MAADVSELRALVSDLGAVAPKVVRGIPPVVHKGANNIRRSMQKDLSQSRYFKQGARSITYDFKIDGDGAEAEIGPDKSTGHASFVHIAYWGGANGGGGTVRPPEGPLEDEAPRFEQALSKLLDGVL